MDKNTHADESEAPKTGFVARFIGGCKRVVKAVKDKAAALIAAGTTAVFGSSTATAAVTGVVPADIEQAAADVNATFVLVSGIIVGVVLFFAAIRFIRRIK